jgi:hypothetical protein
VGGGLGRACTRGGVVEGGAHRRHRPAVMASAVAASALRPGQMRGRRGVRGVRRAYGRACMPAGSASWATAHGHTACGWRWRPNGPARPAATRVRGTSACGHGPDHDGRRVVHAVTTYGRREEWVQRGRWRGADGATSHTERALRRSGPIFNSQKPPLTDLNSRILN